MKQEQLIRSLTEAAVEFEKLEWLHEVVLFGPALQEDPVKDDVDLLLVAHRTLSRAEKRQATVQLREELERRVQQPLDLRITTTYALGTTRSQNVGHGRIFKHETVSVFRRSEA